MVDYKYQKCGKNQKLSITNKGPSESIGILSIQIKKSTSIQMGQIMGRILEIRHRDSGNLSLSPNPDNAG